MGRRALAILMLLSGAMTTTLAAPVGSRSVKEVLHGRVEWLKGRRVAVTYDFKSALQLLDFETVNPFLAPADAAWRVEEGKLVVSGSGAFRWKPVMDPDLEVSFTVTPKDGRDAGVVLVEPEITSRCIVFAIADTFFSKKDVGARILAHMINCCGVPERGAERDNVFRYVDRTWSPVVAPGQEVTATLTKKGDRNRMVILEDAVLEGRDVGIRLPKVQVGLYVLTAKASWTALRIEGTLDASWLRENDIRHDPDEAIPGEDLGGSEDESPDAPPAADPLAQMKAWLEVVKDREASLEDREAAAEKIIDRERICDVPHVVMAGLLYSGDETSRELGIKILQGITGKNLGYSAGASVERRKSAIERWWAWIRQNRPKIDKDEAEGGER